MFCVLCTPFETGLSPPPPTLSSAVKLRPSVLIDTPDSPSSLFALRFVQFKMYICFSFCFRSCLTIHGNEVAFNRSFEKPLWTFEVKKSLWWPLYGIIPGFHNVISLFQLAAITFLWVNLKSKCYDSIEDLCLIICIRHQFFTFVRVKIKKIKNFIDMNVRVTYPWVLCNSLCQLMLTRSQTETNLCSL